MATTTIICPRCGSDKIRPHGLGSVTRATCESCDEQDFVPIAVDRPCAFVRGDGTLCGKPRRDLRHQPDSDAQGTFSEDRISHRFVR